MNIIENFITDIAKYNPDLLNNFNIIKIINNDKKEKVVSEFAFSTLKRIDFTFSAQILKKYKTLYKSLVQTRDGMESLQEFLSDLLYPLQNIKLFNLVIDKLDLPHDEKIKNDLCIEAFFAKNLKAYKKIEKKMSDKVNYLKIFELMENSTPIIINDNSSGHHMMKSNKEGFDYLIEKMGKDDLKELNKKYDMDALENSDFICEFIIKKVHSWDFIHYLNEGLKNRYKNEISEKVQYLMLHSDNKAVNFIPLIVKEKIVDKDNFNYDLLYKKNNVLLLKSIEPDFFKSTRNIEFYKNLVDFVVCKIGKYKDCYNFIQGFLDVEDEQIRDNNIKYLKRFFVKNFITEVESFEDRLMEINSDRFFSEHISKNYFKQDSKLISKEEKLALLENELIKENIDTHDCVIKRKRI